MYRNSLADYEMVYYTIGTDGRSIENDNRSR